ncbi:TVP38/TMEM64 family protein [Paenibacillus athensensis]|uniref:TVP38/TMEM64 family membrane protein n=2 Tax=Paenibacillus athensensis TaxID=1967502 RepID=A0A4Y8PTN3_9BACL|nr:TVP38/TMEM64 family protein [Paenibacillus athensensis]
MYQLSAHLKAMGIYGKLMGMALVFLQTVFPFIPFVVVASANVAIFGIKTGFVVNYTMSCLGAVACFLISRYFAHDWVAKRLHRFAAIQQFSERMERQGFFYVFIGRLIPIFPSSVINLGAGLTRISTGTFIAATLLGKLPMIFLESVIAHDLLHIRHYKNRLLLLLLVFVGLIMLGSWMKTKLSSKA